MCGIVGIVSRTIGGLSFKDLELFEWMLITDTIRGKDSTGAFSGYKNKQVRAIKIATHPFNLFQTTDWHQFRLDSVNRGKFVIGHNRAATRGSVTTNNAHPFVEDNIILVHNGTLWSHENLTTENVEVDSHAIAHALTNKSPEEVLPAINGAFALVWYNTRTETLYAARNSDRPLFILETEHNYIISSEPWIAGGPMAKQDRKIIEIMDIPPGTLVSWDPKGVMSTSEFKLKVYTPVVESIDYTKYYEREEEEAKVFPTGSAEIPEEIQNLREALSGKTSNENTQTPKLSMNCALTQKKDLATGHIPLPTEEERAAAAARSIMCTSDHFKFNDRLLLKVWNTYTDAIKTDRYRWTGKIIHPGKEMVDAWGYLPRGVLPGELREWLEIPSLGSVMFTTDTKNGGMSVFIKDIAHAVMTPIHMGEVPWITWKYASENCNCESCERKIETWEKYFTQVKVKGLFTKTPGGNPLNEATMFCPDCISSRIPIGNFKNSFETKYRNAKEAIKNARKIRSETTTNANSNSSIQEGQSFSQGIGSVFDPKIVIPSSASLQ